MDHGQYYNFSQTPCRAVEKREGRKTKRKRQMNPIPAIGYSTHTQVVDGVTPPILTEEDRTQHLHYWKSPRKKYSSPKSKQTQSSQIFANLNSLVTKQPSSDAASHSPYQKQTFPEPCGCSVHVNKIFVQQLPSIAYAAGIQNFHVDHITPDSKSSLTPFTTAARERPSVSNSHTYELELYLHQCAHKFERDSYNITAHACCNEYSPGKVFRTVPCTLDDLPPTLLGDVLDMEAQYSQPVTPQTSDVDGIEVHAIADSNIEIGEFINLYHIDPFLGSNNNNP